MPPLAEGGNLYRRWYFKTGPMALSIKNRKAEVLAAEVARETGETRTDAVIHALEERLARLRGR